MSAIHESDWRAERRGRLLEAAARIFARQPYGQASMDEIAHEAGVGKPTLYRYFPSKDALFAAVFAETLAVLEGRLDAVLRRVPGVEARLHGLVAAMVPTFRDHLVPVQFLDAEYATADQAKRRVFRQHKAHVAGCLATAIDDGVLSGELRGVDGARIADLIIGMIWSAAASWQADDDEIARQIADVVLRGLEQGDGRSASSRDRGWAPDARGEPLRAALQGAA